MAVLGVRERLVRCWREDVLPPVLCAMPVGPPAIAEDALGPPVLSTCFSGCEGPGRCSAWDHTGSQDADAAPWCWLRVPKRWMVFPSSPCLLRETQAFPLSPAKNGSLA